MSFKVGYGSIRWIDCTKNDDILVEKDGTSGTFFQEFFDLLLMVEKSCTSTTSDVKTLKITG